MKKLLVIMLLLAVLTVLTAHPATNGWERLNLRGRVKSLSVTTGEDDFLYTETTTFDSLGNYLHLHILDMGYVFADADFTPERDSTGKLISLTLPGNEGAHTETFHYDADGHLFQSVRNSEGAGILFTERTFWDLEGRKSLATTHEMNELVWVESYVYNAAGQLFQSIRPASPYSPPGYSIHSFDAYGNRLLTRQWELPENQVLLTRFEYTYDERGNILSSRKFIDYGDGAGEVLEEISTRVYQYFPE